MRKDTEGLNMPKFLTVLRSIKYAFLPYIKKGNTILNVNGEEQSIRMYFSLYLNQEKNIQAWQIELRQLSPVMIGQK